MYTLKNHLKIFANTCSLRHFAAIVAFSYEVYISPDCKVFKEVAQILMWYLQKQSQQMNMKNVIHNKMNGVVGETFESQ